MPETKKPEGWEEEFEQAFTNAKDYNLHFNEVEMELKVFIRQQIHEARVQAVESFWEEIKKSCRDSDMSLKQYNSTKKKAQALIEKLKAEK